MATESLDSLESRQFKDTGKSILERIDASGDCWEWSGYITPAGYGRVRCEGRMWLVHRLVWSALVGPIPDDKQLDHLCRNRSCCNPDHLEVVTGKENVRRGATGKISGAKQRAKTHCPQGHPYNEINTHIGHRRARQCRSCGRDRARARKVD